MDKTCVVIEHLAVEHCGTFKPVLERRGFHVASISAASIARQFDQAKDASLLIVMGAPIGVYDAFEFPFLQTEIELIRWRLDARRPVLGICLGSQLVAAAMGARVFPGTSGFELGWAPVRLTEAGMKHPLAEVTGDDAPVLHWHGDTFDLPNGATLLASTSRYRHQAFAVGNYGLALQFHVETDADGLEQWFVAFAGEIRKSGADMLQNLRRDTALHSVGLAERSGRFMNRWLTGLE
jgi:GMP synthase (glutamine-hydrolysing)